MWHLFAVLIQVAPDASPRQAPALAATWNPLRATLVSWTEPYQQLLGVKQTWHLFLNMRADTDRIEILAREDGAWRPLYVEGPPATDWRAERFTHYRWREALSSLRREAYVRDRRRFAERIAAEIFAEMPAVDAVRVDVVGVRVPPPEVLRETGALKRLEPEAKMFIYRDGP